MLLTNTGYTWGHKTFLSWEYYIDYILGEELEYMRVRRFENLKKIVIVIYT